MENIETYGVPMWNYGMNRKDKNYGIRNGEYKNRPEDILLSAM